jgi:hypothetical protein
VTNIIRPVIDLDKLDKCVRDALTRFLGPCFVNEPEPFPHPTPSLDLLRRFAKVAGWAICNDCDGQFRWRDGVGVGGTWGEWMTEAEACRWLDSPEALDAAAIVAMRKGVGIMVWADTEPAPRFGGSNVAGYRCTVSETRGAGRTDFATSRGRAAVLACVEAFEEV